MKRMLRWGALTLGVLALLSGCLGIPIDEGRVFQPQPIAKKARSVEDMSIKFQEIFERPTNFTFRNNINKDRSSFERTEDDFIPATLRHGFWADGTIAVTEFDTGRPSGPLVVHCGGNASDRHNFGVLFGLKVIPYADLVIFDYPGYGDSPGKPSAASFEAMIDGLADEIRRRMDMSDRRLVLWGYSLGGFVCAELARELASVDAIILESSADNAQNAARQLLPSLLRPFVRLRLSPSLAGYDNVETLSNYGGEVLILTGADDGILPSRLSQALATGLHDEGVSVTYHEFPDGNHANLSTLPSYQEALAAFFGQLSVDEIQTTAR